MKKSTIFIIIFICAVLTAVFGIAAFLMNTGDPISLSQWAVPAALGLGVIFLLVFFLSSLKLVSGSEKLEAELVENRALQDESSASMQSVFDSLASGICVIGRDLLIQDNYNKEFANIFGLRDWKGQPLLSAVFTTWSSGQKEELKQTLELAFNSTVSSDEMLNDILPSREIVTVGALPGDARYVEFSIVRMIRREMVEQIMLIFNDVTLSRKMKQEEEGHQKVIDDQSERINQILQHDRGVVLSFFHSFTSSMESVAGELRKLVKGEVNDEIVRNIVAIVHGIKGEAFSLEF